MSTDLNLVLVMLANLAMLGSSRLSACIRLSAAQGILLSLLPLQLELAEHKLAPRLALFALTILVLKGVVFPALLMRTLRTADVRHEVVPMVGYVSSLIFGVIVLCFSFWVSSRLILPHPAPSPLVLPLALSTILIGLFLIISRKTALMQVVGYLVLENGIFIFGVALANKTPLLVEMGVLLDVFVAVFVMGIAIFHINREFDHIDVNQLTSLKD
ncbi:MAG: hydrogenase [Planctomycetia bacterium]|nr:hydrogenase [Planctomycetia bacterium]